MCLFTNTSTLFRAPGGSRSSAESVSIPHQGKYCVKVFPHTGTERRKLATVFFYFFSVCRLIKGYRNPPPLPLPHPFVRVMHEGRPRQLTVHRAADVEEVQKSS